VSSNHILPTGQANIFINPGTAEEGESKIAADEVRRSPRVRAEVGILFGFGGF
jgi:hypothetical protein